MAVKPKKKKDKVLSLVFVYSLFPYADHLVFINLLVYDWINVVERESTLFLWAKRKVLPAKLFKAAAFEQTTKYQ